MSNGVKIDLNPAVLHASVTSELIVSVFPINSFGFKTPFGETNARFDIEQGANLVQMEDVSPGVVKIRSKGIEGEATLGIYALKSGILLQKILIKILPKDLALKNTDPFTI
jgi:hypothetical protein